MVSFLIQRVPLVFAYRVVPGSGTVPTRSPDTFLAALRRHEPPVIARAGPEAVLLDVRTLRDDQFTAVVHAADAARHDADQH